MVGKPVSAAVGDILLTDETTKAMVNLTDILDGSSTIVIDWWAWH